MDLHEQFWTDEFYRYSAECRRLARLARKPPSAAEGRLAWAYGIFGDWLSDIRRQYGQPVMRYRTQLAATGPGRRYLP